MSRATFIAAGEACNAIYSDHRHRRYYSVSVILTYSRLKKLLKNKNKNLLWLCVLSRKNNNLCVTGSKSTPVRGDEERMGVGTVVWGLSLIYI